MQNILSLLAQHGLERLVARVRLENPAETLFSPQSLRVVLERLGPVFIKFGQLLAGRPDLLPLLWRQELKKLQDSVRAQDFKLIEKALNQHLGRPWAEVFAEIDPIPMGAASLSQVHRAVLRDGSVVVVKVQRSGLEKLINEDISLLGEAVNLLESVYFQLKPLQLPAVVDELAHSLLLELNFEVEARHLKRFAEAFSSDPDIHIPEVHAELSGHQVLVMECLSGQPLCQVQNKSSSEVDLFMRQLWRAYLSMVLDLGFFHADLHGGNIFWLSDNRLALVDFGLVGHLSPSLQLAIVDLLIALRDQNFDRVAQCYLTLAPYSSQTDLFEFAQELGDLLGPRIGGDTQQVNLGLWLMESVALASKHDLQIPRELILFFRSLVTVEGVLKTHSPGFDFLAEALDDHVGLFRSVLAGQGLKSSRDLSQGLRQLHGLMALLPGQVRVMLHRWNSPDYRFPVQMGRLDSLPTSLEKAAGFLAAGLVVSSLILSGTLAIVFIQGSGPFGWPWMGLLAYSLALILGLLSYLKIKA